MDVDNGVTVVTMVMVIEVDRSLRAGVVMVVKVEC